MYSNHPRPTHIPLIMEEAPNNGSGPLLNVPSIDDPISSVTPDDTADARATDTVAIMHMVTSPLRQAMQTYSDRLSELASPDAASGSFGAYPEETLRQGLEVATLLQDTARAVNQMHLATFNQGSKVRAAATTLDEARDGRSMA